VATCSRSRVAANRRPSQEVPLANPKERIRIKLTDEQKTQIRDKTGKDADAVELSVEELEERISPTTTPWKK
jgi:hypothetical protein